MWVEHEGDKAVLQREEGEASREPALEGEGGGKSGEVMGEAGGKDDGLWWGEAEGGLMGWGEGGAACGRRWEAASVRKDSSWTPAETQIIIIIIFFIHGDLVSLTQTKMATTLQLPSNVRN